MNDAHKPTVLAITRHPASLGVIKEFVEGVDIGADFHAVVMDAIVHPESLEESLKSTAQGLESADVVILATKVFDRVAGRNNLPALLARMQHEMPLGDKPLVLTNLDEFTPAEKAEVLAIHPNTVFVSHDNIGANGMANLGAPVRRSLHL